MVTDIADIATIFEYVLGILGYKASEGQGKILDYLKLSLDADLLPKTNAAGGEADIVYEYSGILGNKELSLTYFIARSNTIDELNYVDILKVVRDHVLNTTFVSISTKEGKQTNMIFEILNAKGKNLWK